jgi:hypothetical protein
MLKQNESRSAKVINFHILCRKILNATSGTGGGNIPYARNYIRAGLTMNDWEGCRAQIEYILYNLGGWRGEEARRTKALMKELAGND